MPVPRGRAPIPKQRDALMLSYTLGFTHAERFPHAVIQAGFPHSERFPHAVIHAGLQS